MSRQNLAITLGAIVLFVVAVLGATAFSGGGGEGGPPTMTMPDGSTMPVETEPSDTMQSGETMPGMTMPAETMPEETSTDEESMPGMSMP